MRGRTPPQAPAPAPMAHTSLDTGTALTHLSRTLPQKPLRQSYMPVFRLSCPAQTGAPTKQSAPRPATRTAGLTKPLRSQPAAGQTNVLAFCTRNDKSDIPCQIQRSVTGKRSTRRWTKRGPLVGRKYKQGNHQQRPRHVPTSLNGYLTLYDGSIWPKKPGSATKQPRSRRKRGPAQTGR